MLVKSIELSAGNKMLPRHIHAVQGDSGRILKGILSDCILSPDMSARIYAVKPSGKEVYNDCSIDTENNVVLVNLTTQILAEEGEVVCQIELSSGEKRVTTFDFFIDVDESRSSEAAIESSNEYTALEKLIGESKQATGVAESAAANANKAAQSAETAGQDAAKAAQGANTAADGANEAKSDANAATNTANSAAELATQAANDANIAAQAANEAAENANQYVLGDISDKSVAFMEAKEDADIASGDTLSILFGKILKKFNSIAGVIGTGALNTIDQTIKGAINELNTKINNTNIQNARYITGNIDPFIGSYANEVGVIFGHSDYLSDICGYFVFVMGFGTTHGYYAQLAIGNAGVAYKYFDPQNGWTTWAKL